MFITCNVFLFFCLYFAFDIFGVVFVLFMCCVFVLYLCCVVCCVFYVIWQGFFFLFKKRIYMYVYIHTHVCMYVSEWVNEWVLCIIRSVSDWSLIQTSPTACGVSECDREASIMRRPWPTRGCCAIKKKNIVLPEQSSDTVRHSVIWCQKSSHLNRVSRNDRK